jgi:alpha-glucoside transport system permease protein
VVAKILLALIALGVGVGGIWLLYLGVGGLVSLLQPKWRDRILPWVFVGPALLLLGVFLVYPAAGTILRAFQDNEGQFTLANFAVMTDSEFLKILRNNALWLIFGTGASVLLGLLIAGLFDRVRREALAKTFVFLPLAISLVGASVIWGFMYAWQPAGSPQIGLLNAIVVALGGQPIPWFTTSPVNVFAEIMILVWLQTGFAMVVLSAAIKGVSAEVLEAARLDGATERQLFLQVVVPQIRGSIVTVTTTIAIVTLKIFDIVYVTTGGRFNDDVVGVRMFHEIFQFFNDGRGAALATLLFLAVLPVMYINLRNFKRQQAQG